MSVGDADGSRGTRPSTGLTAGSDNYLSLFVARTDQNIPLAENLSIPADNPVSKCTQ
jgi:hypothetical protein